MIEIGTIIRSFWDKNRDSDTKTQLFQTQLLEEKDSQTQEEMHIPGVQYKPPNESRTFYDRISEAFKIVLGIDDKVPKLETLSEGDRIAYASNSGAIVCSLWYKNDGTIAIATDKDLTADVDGDLTATVLGDLTATVSGTTTVDSTGTLELIAPLIKLTGPVECSSTVDAVGNISTESDMSADGDVFADALATVISLINHFHLGNLGYNTGPSLPAGGGVAPPASPPSAAGGTLDMNGNDITNVSGISDTVGTHKHAQGSDSNGDSEVDTDAPN